MITEAILSLFFSVVDWIVSCIPTLPELGISVSNTLEVFSFALDFFPLDLWIILLTNIIGWLLISSGWVVIEWLYKKIPGVD